MKVGIIGFGRIGKVHAKSLAGLGGSVVVKSVADPYIDEDSIEFAKRNNIANVYKDYNEIYNDKEIDAVLICAPTDQHFILSKQAIEKGKHVFCEKPISHNVGEILEIKRLLSKTNLKYQVGFNRRFDKNFMAVQNAVDTKKIGDLHILRITSRDPSPPPISYVKVSGGIFLDMAIHDFDMVRYISGSEVDSVYAMGGVLVDPEIGKAGDIDTAIISMTLKNGAFASIDNSREAVYGYDQRVEAFGSGGQIIAENETDDTTIFYGKKTVISNPPKHFFLERYMDAYTLELSCFVESIENDKETACNVEDGLKSVLIALACKESLNSKKTIKLEDIEKKYF